MTFPACDTDVDGDETGSDGPAAALPPGAEAIAGAPLVGTGVPPACGAGLDIWLCGGGADPGAIIGVGSALGDGAGRTDVPAADGLGGADALGATVFGDDGALVTAGVG